MKAKSIECDLDGNYEVLQCHETKDECYCVDKMSGKMVPGTMMIDSEPLIDCNNPPITPPPVATTTPVPCE